MLICGSGVGACGRGVQDRRHPGGDRHDVYSAHQGVEHDDMNVLCLGSEVMGPSLAADLVRTFLAARFDGGERVVARLEKIRRDGRRDAGMAESRLHQLSARGQSVWIDYLSRDLLETRRAGADDGRGRRRRRDLEPDDLPEGASQGGGLRRAAERADRQGANAKEIFFQVAGRATSAASTLRPAGTRGTARTARVDRGRPEHRVDTKRREPRKRLTRGSTARTSTSRSRHEPACRRSRTPSRTAARST